MDLRVGFLIVNVQPFFFSYYNIFRSDFFFGVGGVNVHVFLATFTYFWLFLFPRNARIIVLFSDCCATFNVRIWKIYGY